MPRLKLTLEYDGSRYVGWQVQPNGPSIESTLEDALERLLGDRVSVASAGRTDAGVHALGMVASFTTSRTLPMKAYLMGLGGMLPEDISVVDAREVSEDFDPRRWSLGKHYRYSISNRPVRSPLLPIRRIAGDRRGGGLYRALRAGGLSGNPAVVGLCGGCR